jgi:hypothetical protein
MRRLILCTLLVVLAAPAGAPAAFTISTSGPAVSKMGPFKPGKDARLQAAIDAFGTPTSTRVTGRHGCLVKWLNFGLRIRFAGFGGIPAGRTACSPEIGLAQSFVVRSRRFRTWTGLRPGTLEERILDLHPAAEQHGRSWWLQRGERHTGDGRLLAILKAVVRDGRVDRIDGWIGAAGD